MAKSQNLSWWKRGEKGMMSSMKDFQMVTEEQVMFFDTDCGGVVHNLAYLRMIETCRTKMGAKMGFDVKGMGETRLFPVVLRTEADYKTSATLADELEVFGRLEEWGKVRFWCAFEIRRKGEEAVLLTCRQQLAVVQMPEGKGQRLGVEPDFH